MRSLWVTITAVLLLGTTAAAQEHVCEVTDLELDCTSPFKSKKIKLSWRWNEFCKEKDALCILNELSKTDRNGYVYNASAVIMASAGTYEMIRSPRSSTISSYTFQQCDHVQNYNRVTREPIRAKQFIGDNIKLMKNLISPRSASYKWTSPDSVCFSHFNALLVNSNNQTIDRQRFNRSKETHKWTNLHPCTGYQLVMQTISLDGSISEITVGNFKTRVDGTFGGEAVTNLKVTNRTRDKLSIAWGEMTNGQGCIDGYKISIMPKGGQPNKHREFKITDMQYTFQNLQACEVYTISVVGLIGDTQSHNVYIEANTEPASEVKVENLAMTVTSWQNIAMDWEFPRKYAKCLKNTSYTVELCEVTTGNSTRCRRDETESTSFAWSDLRPCGSYVASVKMNDQYEGVATLANTLDFQGTTNTPKGSLSYANLTKTSVDLFWSVPGDFSCTLGHYLVTIESDKTPLEEHRIDYADRGKRTQHIEPCAKYIFSLQLNRDKNSKTIVEFENILLTTQPTGIVNVDGLRMFATSWTSLEMSWEPPQIYRNCLSDTLYTVQLCQVVLDNLTNCMFEETSDTRFEWSGLEPCATYRADVKVNQFPGESTLETSLEFYDTQGETKGSFLVQNVSKTYVDLHWAMSEDFSKCQSEFYINTWEEGRPLRLDRVEYGLRQTQIKHLKPCTRYTFSLQLRKSMESARVNVQFPEITTVTEPSESMRAENATVKSLDRNSLTLNWDRAGVCVTEFTVTFRTADDKRENEIVYGREVRYGKDPCGLERATVYLVRNKTIVGKPSEIDLLPYLFDANNINLDVEPVMDDDTFKQRLRVVSRGGVQCGDGFKVAWFFENGTSVPSFPTSMDTTEKVIQRLQPCTNYTAGFTVLRGGKTRIEKSLDVYLPIEPKLTLKAVEAVDRGAVVTWSDKYGTGPCLRSVQVCHFGLQATRSGLSPECTTVPDKSTTSYNIANLEPCTRYVVLLKANDKYQHTSTISIPSVALPVPQIPQWTTTNTSVTLSFHLPKPVGACKAHLTVQCLRSNEPVRSKTISFDSETNRTVKFDRLQTNAEYTCCAYFTSADKESAKSVWVFSTDEGVPSAPTEVKVAAASDRLLVSWRDPEHVGGNLTRFTVTLGRPVFNYDLPSDCFPPGPPAGVNVSGNIYEVTVANLFPNARYSVSVSAATIAGEGPVALTEAKTEPGKSSPVRSLQKVESESNVNMTKITWKSPCYLGSDSKPLFEISFSGKRDGFNVKSLNYNQNTTELMINNTANLIAEATYTLTVVPVGIDNAGEQIAGESASTNFTVPARIPPVTLKVPTVEMVDDRPQVTLPRDLFSDAEGSLRQYVILLAESAGHVAKSGWLNARNSLHYLNWANASRSRPVKTYQTTPAVWCPFTDSSESVVFVLGLDDCSKSKSDEYCNGPLVTGAKYVFWVRGYTANGYRDTRAQSFFMEEPISLSSVALTCVIVASIFAIISFGVLGVRGHILWLKEKERAEIEASDPQQDQSYWECLRYLDDTLSSKERLQADFAAVNRQQLHTQNIAQLEENKPMNRYGNILPYDKNRVVLTGDAQNDYINASHIQLIHNRTNYIASQAPKDCGAFNFWRMIAQNKIDVIVMLCMLIENDKNKCFKYYPTAGEKVEFEDNCVECVEEQISPIYTVRRLRTEVGTRVTQFHFTKWPDFGVPHSPEAIVKFVAAVRTEIRPDSVVLVHCSAGVGRTGTFIALDSLLQQIHRRDFKINVLETVLSLRNQRCKMVQTEDQYEYIFKCLKWELENHVSFITKGGSREINSKGLELAVLKTGKSAKSLSGLDIVNM